MSALISSCDSSQAKKSLRLPLAGHLVLDPAHSTPSDLWADSLLYAGLVKFDGSMNVVPDLAVALPSITQGGRSYTFTLRSDARFANGDPVTAADVAFSLSRALSPREHSHGAWRALHVVAGASSVREGRSDRLSGVQVLGRHRLRISLVTADSTFLDDLALPLCSVLDRSQSSVRDLLKGRPGAGPFMLRSMGKRIHLIRNSHYYGGHLALRRLTLVPSSRYDQYSKHEVDAIQVPERRYGRASKAPQFTATDVPRAYYVALTGVRSRRLRVALDQALDRSKLARSTIAIDPSISLVPQVVPGYPAVSDPRVYQPARARGILAGHEIQISGMGTAPKAVSRWLARSWRAAGAKIRPGSGANRLRMISVHVSLPEPQAWLRMLGHVLRLRSPTFDELLARADSVPFSDEQRQLALDTRGEKYIFRRSIIIPLGVRKEGYLISPHVQGLSATPIGLEPASEDWTTVSVS